MVSNTFGSGNALPEGVSSYTVDDFVLAVEKAGLSGLLPLPVPTADNFEGLINNRTVARALDRVIGELTGNKKDCLIAVDGFVMRISPRGEVLATTGLEEAATPVPAPVPAEVAGAQGALRDVIAAATGNDTVQAAAGGNDTIAADAAVAATGTDVVVVQSQDAVADGNGNGGERVIDADFEEIPGVGPVRGHHRPGGQIVPRDLTLTNVERARALDARKGDGKPGLVAALKGGWKRVAGRVVGAVAAFDNATKVPGAAADAAPMPLPQLPEATQQTNNDSAVQEFIAGLEKPFATPPAPYETLTTEFSETQIAWIAENVKVNNGEYLPGVLALLSNDPASASHYARETAKLNAPGNTGNVKTFLAALPVYAPAARTEHVMYLLRNISELRNQSIFANVKNGLYFKLFAGLLRRDTKRVHRAMLAAGVAPAAINTLLSASKDGLVPDDTYRYDGWFSRIGASNRQLLGYAAALKVLESNYPELMEMLDASMPNVAVADEGQGLPGAPSGITANNGIVIPAAARPAPVSTVPPVAAAVAADEIVAGAVAGAPVEPTPTPEPLPEPTPLTLTEAEQLLATAGDGPATRKKTHDAVDGLLAAGLRPRHPRVTIDKELVARETTEHARQLLRERMDEVLGDILQKAPQIPVADRAHLQNFLATAEMAGGAHPLAVGRYAELLKAGVTDRITAANAARAEINTMPDLAQSPRLLRQREMTAHAAAGALRTELAGLTLAKLREQQSARQVDVASYVEYAEDLLHELFVGDLYAERRKQIPDVVRHAVFSNETYDALMDWVEDAIATQHDSSDDAWQNMERLTIVLDELRTLEADDRAAAQPGEGDGGNVSRYYGQQLLLRHAAAVGIDAGRLFSYTVLNAPVLSRWSISLDDAPAETYGIERVDYKAGTMELYPLQAGGEPLFITMADEVQVSRGGTAYTVDTGSDVAAGAIALRSLPAA